MQFSYDAAQRQAEKHNLQIVQICHADLPPGTSTRDGYGNYLTAKTVYIGSDPNAMPRDCAYGRCVHTIHQIVEPDIACALRDIAEHLQTANTFQNRAEYEEYYRNCIRSEREWDALRAHWRDSQNTAQRAHKCLPADLITWLLSL